MVKVKKRDAIRGIADKAGVNVASAACVFDATFSYIAEQLSAGNSISVPGFGTFSVDHRSERRGRNLRTKDEIIIPARTVPSFKAAPTLKDAVKDTDVV